MSDLLERATRASRQTPTPGPSPDETRARILATVRREAVRPPRRLRHGWSIPLVAALLATGAAAAVGSHPFALFGSPAPAVSLTPATPSASPQRTSPSAVRTAEPPAEPPTEAPAPIAPATADRPTAPTTVTAPTTAPPVVSAAPVVTAPNGVNTPDKPTAPATDDPAEALYREAHSLHFRGGDAGAAVAAWERYLAAAPRGRFAPEARYNRALALLRAGRREAGLGALAPFASAPPGSYRQAEAQRLLAAAQGGPPPSSP